MKNGACSSLSGRKKERANDFGISFTAEDGHFLSLSLLFSLLASGDLHLFQKRASGLSFPLLLIVAQSCVQDTSCLVPSSMPNGPFSRQPRLGGN